MDTRNGSTEPLPLISPKHFRDFTPEEYQAYVKTFYEERTSRGPKVRGGRINLVKTKPQSFAEGLKLKRLKSGVLSISRTKKRSSAYVTYAEIEAMSKGYGFSQAEVWNAFRLKHFIIARTLEEAEVIMAKIAEIPWSS